MHFEMFDLVVQTR